MMPRAFKKRAHGTDARVMSETAVNHHTDTAARVGDDDTPRLASAPIAAPTLPGPSTPMAPPPSSAPTAAPTMSVAPSGAPDLPMAVPEASAPALPSLPTAAPATPQRVAEMAAEDDGTGSESASGEPSHPMAHLMPAKSKQTEASRRAAEARAAHKKKAKRVKIAVIAGMIAFTALVGPPLFKWLSNAINEAGDTKTVEQPAG
jgi:hypothetical protein